MLQAHKHTQNGAAVTQGQFLPTACLPNRSYVLADSISTPTPYSSTGPSDKQTFRETNIKGPKPASGTVSIRNQWGSQKPLQQLGTQDAASKLTL